MGVQLQTSLALWGMAQVRDTEADPWRSLSAKGTPKRLDLAGRPPGVYFVRIAAEGRAATRAITLVR